MEDCSSEMPRIKYAADRESTYSKMDISHNAELRDLQACIIALTLSI
jgi:hypothetical protein